MQLSQHGRYYYRQAILPNPVTEIVFFFFVAGMICIENDITVSAVKLSNVLFWKGSLSIAINAPDLLKFVFSKNMPNKYLFSLLVLNNTAH